MDEPQVEFVAAAPRPSLAPLIAGYTGYRVHGPAGTHRGLPSRHLTLIVTLAGTVDIRPGPSLGALVGGLHAAPVLITHDGYQHGVQVDLTPLGARALLGPPAGELADRVVELPALLGRAAATVTDQIRSAATWADRFAHLDALFARVASPTAIPPELAWAWHRLVGAAGRVGVGTLAAEVGWSRQHLGAMFRREYGLSPKVAARVMRFERAQRLLAAPSRPGLAEIASRCGYADQSHLNRDWYEFSGATPSTWLAEELPFVQDGVVARDVCSIHD